jgi:tetratricopeptide (TPR) repeat protein
MSDDFSAIRPKKVPLSHVDSEPQAVTGKATSVITWGLGVLLALALLIGVFVVVPAWLENARQQAPIAAGPTPTPAATDPGAGASPAAAAAAPRQGGTNAGPDTALPPFQELQRQQAREQAQKELARFVELQIELEQSMQVGAWGADAYRQAKDLAAAGDQAFVQDQFQQAVEKYQQATEGLEALIERGRGLLEKSIQDGTAALAARDQERAERAFELAGTIDANDPRIAAGKARAALLPEVGALMREARNHELAERWADAQRTYQRVQQLDAATSGLAEAMTRVGAGQTQARVQTLLSDGFARLEEGRFDAARSAFRDALALQPGNPVAEGGLEQVARRADVSRINDLRQQAEKAEREERWAEAEALYGKVLAQDGAIAFAQAGRANAAAQQRTHAALANILQNPDRLSSENLYREAEEILARAEALDPKGATLSAQIADVRATLAAYADPVPVVLRSDNLTQVTLSTVGPLGSFTEKQLALRPGSYTVIGSRDGCRDVREQIVVRENMNPIDIRCVETL